MQSILIFFVGIHAAESSKSRSHLLQNGRVFAAGQVPQFAHGTISGRGALGMAARAHWWLCLFVKLCSQRLDALAEFIELVQNSVSCLTLDVTNRFLHICPCKPLAKFC